MTLVALFLTTVAAAQPTAAGDAFYEALLGLPEVASPRELLSGPGRYVGRAITTRGRLERAGGGLAAFHLATSSGSVLLKLEPEVAGLVASRASEWVGRQVEVDGLFHRDAGSRTTDAHALRAWRVAPVDRHSSGTAPGAAAPFVRLEDLVYAGGGYDGQLVRVRGVVRGPAGRDLPEATRQRGDDWILKDGYFAAWITGRRPVAAATSVVAVEVVGVPTTAAGVVRIAARDVAAIDPSQVTVTRPPVSFGPHPAAPVPRVSFTHPGPDDPLGPHGHVIIQFNHPMDPASLRDGVRARYEGRDPARTRVEIEYRHRHYALVVTPQEPPAGRPLVVELLDAVVDVDGRGLVPRAGTVPRGDVVEEIRFSNAP